MTEGSLGRPFGILLLQFVWRNKTQAVKPDFQVVKAGSFTPSLTSDLDCCRRTLGLDECARDNPLIVRKAEASEFWARKAASRICEATSERYRSMSTRPNGLCQLGIVPLIGMPLTIWELRFPAIWEIVVGRTYSG